MEIAINLRSRMASKRRHSPAQELLPPSQHRSIGPAIPVNKRVAVSNSAQVNRSCDPGKTNGNGHSFKAKKPVEGKPHNKSVDVGNIIYKGTMEYKYTKIYKDACMKTFKTKEALKKFNSWAETNSDHIDPAHYIVCGDCGHCDLQLCECMVTNAPTAVTVSTDTLFTIPTGKLNVKWTHQWVNSVRRMFTWPTYNPELPINHNIGIIDNSLLPENEMLIPDMLAYIRLHQNTSYVLNNVFDREAKLAHSKKLALRFLDECKMKHSDRNAAGFVARMHFTVQKATDSGDDNFLFAKCNEDHNILSFLPAPVKVVQCIRTLIKWLCIVSLILIGGLLVASMMQSRTTLSPSIIVPAQTLVSGSFSHSESLHLTDWDSLLALSDAISSGTCQHYLTEAEQRSCNIVRTMSETELFADISKQHPSLRKSTRVLSDEL